MNIKKGCIQQEFYNSGAKLQSSTAILRLNFSAKNIRLRQYAGCCALL